MSRATTELTLRLRLAGALSAAIGLIAVMAAVGALFPAVGHSIGRLNVPKSVSNLLGGADYGTITGWFRSEIAVIYGPLVIAALAITGASAVTAGEEEDRITALVLAYPIRRSQLIVAKAAAIGGVVLIVAFATWIGLTVGVAIAGGGITIGHITALKRMGVAPFGAERQWTFESLEAMPPPERTQVLLPVDAALVDWRRLDLPADGVLALRQGQPLSIPVERPGNVRIYAAGVGFLGLGAVGPLGRLVPLRLISAPTNRA